MDLLGDLGDRRIWEAHGAPNRSEPISRLNVIKNWLAECSKSHPYCEKVLEQDPPQLPTRVLAISEGDDEEPFKIRLHVSNGEHAPYAVLSHCWGQVTPLKTLRSNIEEHKDRISYNDLPLTFQDAVLMAWYVLDCPYLWIDSLCIIQDDKHDWEIEAATMATVYANAMLTFAATAAKDASYGCTFQYDSALRIASNDGAAMVRFEDHLNLNAQDAPLNSRGWCFQESALSKRMVCFPEEQMLWKCSSKHESEDGLLNTSNDSHGWNEATWNVWASLRRIGEGQSSYSFWYRMMENYSRRILTFDEDKLAALAGIVAEFQNLIKDVPVMGIWQGDLLDGLLWRTAEPMERLKFIPSWSWASIKGRVAWEEPMQALDKMEIITVTINWTGPPMISQVIDARLTVRGRLKKACISKWEGVKGNSCHLHEVNEPAVDSQRSPNVAPSETSTAPEVLGYCYLEDIPPELTHVWCLEVYFCSRLGDVDEPRNHVHRVLILVPTGDDVSEFTRIGVGEMWSQSFKQDKGMGTAVKETFKGVEPRIVSIL